MTRPSGRPVAMFLCKCLRSGWLGSAGGFDIIVTQDNVVVGTTNIIISSYSLDIYIAIIML